MVQERSRELQQKLTNEALAYQELFGSTYNVANYEQAIRLIGKACGIPRSDTETQLALIQQNREDLRRIEAGGVVPKRVLEDSAKVVSNWSGLETLDVITDLFEVSLNLEHRGQRQAVYNMAMELMETQCLLDWVQKTPAEKEMPDLIPA